MGFGLLFIGYIFFLYVLPIGTQFLSVAAAILLYALHKLSRYHVGFRRAAYLSLVLFVLGLPSLADILFDSYGISLPIPPLMLSILTAASFAALIVFHVFLFGAIADLAKQTSLFRLQVAATQNRLFTAVFCTLLLINEVLTPYLVSLLEENDAKRVLIYILLGKALFGLIIAGLNLVMLYSAYMRFCPPGQEKRGVSEYQKFIDAKKAETKPKKEDSDK
jgi:hypothetical protein